MVKCAGLVMRQARYGGVPKILKLHGKYDAAATCDKQCGLSADGHDRRQREKGYSPILRQLTPQHRICTMGVRARGGPSVAAFAGAGATLCMRTTGRGDSIIAT